MADAPEHPGFVTELRGIFVYGRRALALVWSTSVVLTLGLGALTLVSGLLPAATAYVGQRIVDAVIAGDLHEVYAMVAIEGVLVALMAASARGQSVCESLLRAQLGHRVNVLILEKASTLELPQFEDSEFYDKLTRARREASARPLSLVRRTFALAQSGISLVGLAALLWQFSPFAVAILLLAGLPSFLVEAKYSGDAFRLFRWRSPQSRKQMYLETLLAREDYAKEVKVYGLGALFLERYRSVFQELYAEDRQLTLRRGFWGFGLGLLGTAAFYGAYAWIGRDAVAGEITLGQMTMYLLVFKQGQSAVSAGLGAVGGMYEDNLYLSNLYEYLEQPVPGVSGTAQEGPRPGDGFRFEGVGFTYPGATEPALDGIDLHLPLGRIVAFVGENGSGKTTLMKLLTRLYEPSVGRILFEGLDLRDWDPDVFRRRIGVIFQDFARYQLSVGENIGVGDAERIDDPDAWEHAARLGTAHSFLERLPRGYHTQLGKWFAEGRELSGGQWQKIALSRAFMGKGTDVWILDEPTAAMDADAEAEVFEAVRSAAGETLVVLVSHRFSNVRLAADIVVLAGGRVIEQGAHEDLMALGGTYARWFALQAAGYLEESSRPQREPE